MIRTTSTSSIPSVNPSSIKEEGSVARNPAAQVLQEPTRRHPDKDCVIALVIGKPDTEGSEQIRGCELGARSAGRDFGVLMVQEQTDATHTLISDTLLRARRDHPDRQVQVKELWCGDAEDRPVDMTRLPLADCEVSDLKSGHPWTVEPQTFFWGAGPAPSHQSVASCRAGR